MQVSFGEKKYTKVPKATDPKDSKTIIKNNVLKIMPTSAQIKDYLSWWSLVGLGSYGMYWGLQKYGYQLPGISTPGQMVWGTAAGMAGVYCAQTGRDTIHETYQLKASHIPIKDLKIQQTTWQSFMEDSPESLLSSDEEEISGLNVKAFAAFSTAALITCWSIVYNPWGFKIIGELTTKNNIWTKTILPISTNALIAQTGYFIGSKLLSLKSQEDDYT